MARRSHPNVEDEPVVSKRRATSKVGWYTTYSLTPNQLFIQQSAPQLSASESEGDEIPRTKQSVNVSQLSLLSHPMLMSI